MYELRLNSSAVDQSETIDPEIEKLFRKWTTVYLVARWQSALSDTWVLSLNAGGTLDAEDPGNVMAFRSISHQQELTDYLPWRRADQKEFMLTARFGNDY